MKDNIIKAVRDIKHDPPEHRHYWFDVDEHGIGWLVYRDDRALDGHGSYFSRESLPDCIKSAMSIINADNDPYGFIDGSGFRSNYYQNSLTGGEDLQAYCIMVPDKEAYAVKRAIKRRRGFLAIKKPLKDIFA